MFENNTFLFSLVMWILRGQVRNIIWWHSRRSSSKDFCESQPRSTSFKWISHKQTVKIPEIVTFYTPLTTNNLQLNEKVPRINWKFLEQLITLHEGSDHWPDHYLAGFIICSFSLAFASMTWPTSPYSLLLCPSMSQFNWTNKILLMANKFRWSCWTFAVHQENKKSSLY